MGWKAVRISSARRTPQPYRARSRGVSAAAHCGEDRHVLPVLDLRLEPGAIADAALPDEHVDVAAEAPLLIEHSREHARVPLPQGAERFSDRGAGRLDAHLARAGGERAEKPRQVERDGHARAARTQTIGGRPLA